MQSHIRRLTKAERRARNIDKRHAILANWDLFTRVLSSRSFLNNPDAELLGKILKKEFNYSNFTNWYDVLAHFYRLKKTMTL